MKTIGILGGVGPETTANFYLYIMSESQSYGAVARPNLLIQNLPIPYEVEKEALLYGNNVEAFLPYLLESSRLLEAAGADFIVMPCNTLHRFENEIRNAIKIPFISIVDVTAKYLKTTEKKTVGIISTKITLEAKFYQNKLQNMGIETRVPSDFDQARIAKMIHGLVTNKYANSQRQVLLDVIENFANESIELALLACTDLQALIPQNNKIQIVDTMQLLADEVVERIHL